MPTWAETNERKSAKQRTERILDGLRSLPGIEAATTAGSLPGVPNEYQIELKTTEGRAESEPKLLAQGRWVSPEYFAAMRVPIIAGEVCREEANTNTAMVNRSFADLYLNGSAAIGRHLVQPDNPYMAEAEIRGIVGDARETGLDREPPPTAYWCNGTIQPGTYFLIRTRGEPNSMAGTVRRKIHELEPQRSVYDLSPLTDHISDAYAENRLRTVLLAFFALTAIALASVGLYGTLSYLVNVRQREVALRMALGALRMQVARQFLNQGLRVSGLGCIAGLALSAALAQVLSGMLFGVSATDVTTWGRRRGHSPVDLGHSIVVARNSGCEDGPDASASRGVTPSTLGSRPDTRLSQLSTLYLTQHGTAAAFSPPSGSCVCCDLSKYPSTNAQESTSRLGMQPPVVCRLLPAGSRQG